MGNIGIDGEAFEEPEAAEVRWPPRALAVGQRVQYFSETHGAWVDCVVTGTEADGRVEVSCKKGGWMAPLEWRYKLRPSGLAVGGPAAGGSSPSGGAPAPAGAGMVPGDLVMYWSHTHARWVPGKILGVRPTGEVQVDVKPGHWMSHEEQGERLRPPDGILDGFLDAAGRCVASSEARCCWRGLSERALAEHNLGVGLPEPAPQPPLFGDGSGGGTPQTASQGGSPTASGFQLPLGFFGGGEPPGSVRGGGGAAAAASPGQAGDGGVSSVLASMASFGSASVAAPAPALAASPAPKGVGFESSVEVMAFKERCPPDRLHDKARHFESSVDRRIEVPKAWSFDSMSSLGSMMSSGGQRSAQPLPASTLQGPRLPTVGEDAELQGAAPPPGAERGGWRSLIF